MSSVASILTTIGLLLEVLVCSVLVAALYYFIPSYFRSRKPAHLILSIIFSTFLVYVAATLIFQFFIRYERSIFQLIFIQRIIAVSLLIGSFSLFIFTNIRSRFRGDRGVIFLSFIVFIGLIGAVIISPISLMPRGVSLEPQIIFNRFYLSFLPFEPTRLIWFLMWGLFGAVTLANFFLAKKSEAGQRVLYCYSAISSFLFILAFILMQGYFKEVTSLTFLLSWLFILLGSIGVALGEGIDPKSKLALNPLDYFRSRLLFKIIFGFVFFIILLFWANHILTFQLTKTTFRREFSEDLFVNYVRIVNNAAYNVSALGRADPSRIYKVISKINFGPGGSIIVVDSKGRLIAKTRNIRMKYKEDLSYFFPVKMILEGKSGSAEFLDEFGIRMAGAYRPIRRFNLGIVVQQPVSAAFKQMNKLETDALFYVISGTILTILVGFIFASTLEKPLRRLADATHAVAAGDLSHHIKTGSIDELGTLSQDFNQMTNELRETQNRLVVSEKMIALGNMAAGMAHEIRNPLVSLRTFTQLLDLKWDDPEFRKKFSTIVPREIERINRIAESLLKFGRPWQAEIKEVNISSVLEEVLLLFEPEMKKKGVILKTKFTDVPSFKGDAPQLVQAFTNIVKNAIEAIGDKGGGELYIETEYIIALKLKGRVYSLNEMTWGHRIEEKPYVMVKIADTGGGVPEGKLRNLFDPFFTSKTYGTGMGLPITLRIIEEHRGTVKVKTKPGEGTSFIVYLPQEGGPHRQAP